MSAAGPIPQADLVSRHVYEADEVDEYIAYLHRELETLRAEVLDARRAAEEYAARVGDTERVEALLGRALLTAQRAADEAIADAQRLARSTIAEAERRANEIVRDAQRRAASDPATGSLRDQAQRIVEDAHRTLDALMSSTPPLATPRRTEDAAAFPWRAPDDRGADTGARVVRLPTSDPTMSDRRPWIERPDPPPWARMPLQATGTETGARQRIVLLPPPEPEPSFDWIADDQPEDRRPGEALHASLATLRERWRLARDGSASLDDDFFSRPGHLESLQDGSYVDTLREFPSAPVAAWTPPPDRRRTGWRAWLFGQPGSHARF